MKLLVCKEEFLSSIKERVKLIKLNPEDKLFNNKH
jgi:hypothetical protein